MQLHDLFEGPTAKILDYIINNQDKLFGMKEVMKGAGYGKTLTNKVIVKLERLGIIEFAGLDRKRKVYKLNLDNPITQMLIDMKDVLERIVLIK